MEAHTGKAFVLLCTIVFASSASTCYDGYCLNGGTCSVFQGNASCSCPSNFTGDRCQTDVDECQVLSNPCKNGATCSDFFGGYFCRCIYGYEGFDCSINKDDCISLDGNPLCLSGGTCVDRVGKYDCICPPGKTGPVCQFVDECHSIPCYGSASCLTDAFGRHSCFCPRGWTGKNCSIDIDDCVSVNSSLSPCHHGSTCVNTPGSFVCQCVPGYTGPVCQFVDECHSIPCYGSATCLTDAFGRYSCLCPRGWTGKSCSIDIDNCVSVNSSLSPCHHGGTCVNTPGSFVCQCVPGHTALDIPCNSPCLLVSTGTEIIALDYNTATIYPIISNLSRAVAIDIHFSLKYIFWSDTAEKNIKRSNINGTNTKVLHNNTGNCMGLAVDWISSQLYWTDEDNGTISVSDLEGNNKRVLLSLSPHYPEGIALDPERGLMFWTVYNFGIKKSTLHGTLNVTLVTSLRSPQGIGLDRQNKLVFWVDELLGTVESVDYDGNNRRFLYWGSSFNLFEVTFFSSYLFVSDQDRSPSGILKLNTSNGACTSFLPVPSLGKVWGLVTYDSSRQPPGFYCEPLSIPVHGGINTPCSRFPGYPCQFTCQRGYSLIGSAVRWCNNDGTWTGTQPRCHAVMCPTLSTPTSGVLSGCDTTEMLLDTVCRFSCKNVSQASGSTARRCTDNGTWSGTDLVCTGRESNDEAQDNTTPKIK